MEPPIVFACLEPRRSRLSGAGRQLFPLDPARHRRGMHDGDLEPAILGGPLAALLYQKTGTWTTVFAVVIVMNFAAAALALAVLKPARRRYLAT